MTSAKRHLVRLAAVGCVIAAALALISILTPALVLAWEWWITDGHIADAGHPPLSIYLFAAALYFLPALSLLGLLLAWLGRGAGSRLQPTAVAVHAIALALSAVGWAWMTMSNSLP